MNPSISAAGSKKTQIGASPFEHITLLEQQEKERVELEISAMQSEKEAISQSIAKKEEQTTEELRAKAKQELKKFSEDELSAILSKAGKDADAETVKLEERYIRHENEARAGLLARAGNPETYFPAKA